MSQSFKKNFTRICALGMSFAMFGGVNVYADTTGVVSASKVNVRSGASTDTSVVASVTSGQAVNITDQEGDFYKITVPGVTDAYVSKQFINVGGNYGTINDEPVNIRKTPSTDAEVVGKAAKGDKFEIVALNGDWYTVKYNGADAFVHKDYLNPDQVTAVAPKAAPVVPEVVAPEAVAPKAAAVVPEAVEAVPAEPAPVAQASEAVAQEESSTEDTGNIEAQSEPVAVEEVYALVTAESGLNLRTAPSTDSEVIAVISAGNRLEILEDNGEWLKVSYSGNEGYVSSEFVSIRTGNVQEVSTTRDAQAQEVIAYAEQFLGTPYVYGGTDLNTGVDCSGFVYSVMQNFGINLNRSSRDMAYNGRPISKDELLPGDLIFFSSNGSTITHVAIYIGDGKYIHSTDYAGKGVSYADMNDSYSQKTYHSAVRVIE